MGHRGRKGADLLLQLLLEVLLHRTEPVQQLLRRLHRPRAGSTDTKDTRAAPPAHVRAATTRLEFQHRSPAKDWRLLFKLPKDGAEISKRILSIRARTVARTCSVMRRRSSRSAATLRGGRTVIPTHTVLVYMEHPYRESK